MVAYLHLVNQRGGTRTGQIMEVPLAHVGLAEERHVLASGSRED